MASKDPTAYHDYIEAMSNEQRQQWIRDMVRRLVIALQLKDRKTLSLSLGLHPNTVSNWSQKGTIPWETVYNCHQATGRSLDWLITGKEPAAPTQQNEEKMERDFETDLTEFIATAQNMEIVKNNDQAGSSLLNGIMAIFRNTQTKNKP